MSLCCCCFGRGKGQRGRSKARDDSPNSRSKSKEADLHSPLSCNSFVSEYHDAQEFFSVGDVAGGACTTGISPRHSAASHDKHQDLQPSAQQPQHGPGPGADPLPAAYHSQSGLAGSGASPAVGATTPCASSVLTASGSARGPSDDHAAMAKAADAAVDKTLSSLRHNSGFLAGTSETSEEPLDGAGGGALGKLAGCLTILENIRMPAIPGIPGVAPAQGSPGMSGPGASGAAHAGAGGGVAAEPGGRPTARRLGGKLEPGCTLRRRDMSEGLMDVREAWEPCDEGEGPSTSGRPFMVRSIDYMRSRVKVPSRGALYRLLAADVISTDTKLTHVARLANLQHLMQPASDPHLPPLLILTIMLPMYPASIFGASDGPNQSLVFYFGLPPDFNAAAYENQAALALLRRFVTNGREADGSPTRDRCKLIPRVVNVDEWVQKGPLSPAEAKLLNTYNGKPVLTRPQHYFFHGPGYMEVDIDIHTYQFLARKALNAYQSRLHEVIWENAFVIQGNGPDELPEQVLAAVRMFRVDLSRARPLRDYITPGPGAPPSASMEEEPAGKARKAG